MEMKYYPRLVTDKLQRALKSFPVVIIGGARQTGKSTIVRKDPLFQKRPYFTCDDPQTLLSMKSSGTEFLNSSPQMTIDEAQRIPEIFLTLKYIVDENRIHGRFLISGSAQFLLLRKLGDSLAGRAAYIRLMPVTIHELLGRCEQPSLYTLFEKNGISKIADSGVPDWNPDWLIRGGFPEPAWDKSIDVRLWFSAYEATYLDRDLRDLSSNIDPLTYQRFLRVAASRNGMLMNQADIAQAAGLNNVTCGRYIHLLETSGLISRIYPWHANSSKRWVKSPRLLFADVALAAHLAGTYQALPDHKHTFFGQHMHSLVLQNIAALVEAHGSGAMKLFHCRSSDGMEVDAVVEYDGRQIVIEIKSADRVDSGDGKNLRKFLELNPGCILGIVAYRGKRILTIGKNIIAIPLSLVLN